MAAEFEIRVRGARRTDVHTLTNLRVSYLAEMARLEPRLRLLPDVRERTESALPVWIDQTDRVLLVAELPGEVESQAEIHGYATGVNSVWPPVLRHQRVGEIAEVFVQHASRGRGIGRELLTVLRKRLLERGAHVLRAPVPVRNEISRQRFRAMGFLPVQHVLLRKLEEV